MADENRDIKTDKVIDDLMECYSVTTQLLPYCLQMGGDHVAARHMVTMMEVAELTRLGADFLLKESAYSKALGQITADACKTLAVSCQNFPDDQNMKTCGEVAERCAATLTNFAGT